MPFFSIIVPVYNRADIIQKTIRQILLQTYPDFELIVVDDGSDDNSYEKASAITSDKLQVYKKQNGERAAARNFGAKLSKGKYLIFFDSDDLMFPYHLEVVHNYIMINHFPGVMYTGFEFVDENKNVLSKVLVDQSKFRRHLLKDNFLGCNSVIIRENIFKEFWFNENRKLSTAEDKELWLRVASGYNFHSIPNITFAMVEHKGRSLNSMKVDKLEEKVIAFIESLESNELFKKSFSKQYKFIFAYEYSLLSSEWAANKNLSKSAAYLFKAFKLSKSVIFTKRFLAAIKNFLFLKLSS